MKEKKKIAPLCRGANLICKLTVPLIVVEIVYILVFISSLGAQEILSQRDVLSVMIEDVLASVLCSVFGMLLFDWAYKRENDQLS